MYTDGSKDLGNGHGVGIAIPEFKVNISKIISNNVAIYAAELFYNHNSLCSLVVL